MDNSTNNTLRPCLVGDFWALKMSPFFKNKYGFASVAGGDIKTSDRQIYRDGKTKTAESQIRDYLQKNDAKYFVCHVGLNNLTDHDYNYDSYLDVIYSTSNTPIFFFPVPKTYSLAHCGDEDLSLINNTIKSACFGRENAHFCDFGDEIMEGVRDRIMYKNVGNDPRSLVMSNDGFAWYADVMMNYLFENNLI